MILLLAFKHSNLRTPQVLFALGSRTVHKHHFFCRCRCRCGCRCGCCCCGRRRRLLSLYRLQKHTILGRTKPNRFHSVGTLLTFCVQVFLTN